MDYFEQFPEAQPPPKNSFYSSLTEEEISEKDYTHAKRLFNHFNMINHGNYYKFYMLTNVLLLADMCENFRDVCLQHYGLDTAHKYTSPGLSWQTAFKMTDVELDLLTDIDQHLLIEEEIRGGVAMISHRYARTNAPGMGNYNTSKRNSHIMYLDANNLNGWAMWQPLPTSYFKWVTDEETEELDVMIIPNDSSRVYILEYDLIYLYIHEYFIECDVLSYVFQSTLVIS